MLAKVRVCWFMFAKSRHVRFIRDFDVLDPVQGSEDYASAVLRSVLGSFQHPACLLLDDDEVIDFGLRPLAATVQGLGFHNPKPYTPKPVNPSTLNPKPLNPKPQTAVPVFQF